MTADGRGDAPDKSVNEAADDVAKSVAETANAILGVGVSLARLAAKVTAPAGRDVQITPGQGPVSEIVQYGIAATANVLRVVPAALGDVTRAVAGPRARTGPAPSAPAAPPSIPTVRAGGSLRIPLSIENPSDQPMTEMRFAVTRMDYDGAGAGLALAPSAIRFEPMALTVAPRDFEKLTVFIGVEAGTAPGVYVATIGLPNGAFETTLPFEIVRAATSPAPPP